MPAKRIIRIIKLNLLIFFLSGCATGFLDNTSTSSTMGSRYIQEKKQDKKTVIIFVHGVTGNSTSTWTNDSSHAYWPLLFANDSDFEDANIYVFEYPSPSLRKSLTINELAESMRSRLQADGVLEHSRLVFLSHSMGGLITRSFLLKYRELAANVPFAYFFATPTEGSPMATLTSLVSRNPQFKNIYPLEADNNLGDLQRDWLAAQLNIDSYCAYERKDTFGLLVVDQKSAAGLCTKPLDPILENHIDIVKPENIRSDAYIVFKNAYKASSQTYRVNKLGKVNWLLPVLIINAKTSEPESFMFVIEVVNQSDKDAYFKEVELKGEVDQKQNRIIQIGKKHPKLSLHIIGFAEGSPKAEPGTSSVIRYHVQDFTKDRGQVMDGYIGNSSDESSWKFVTSDPTIDNFIDFDETKRPKLHNDFNKNSISVFILSGNNEIHVEQENLMDLVILTRQTWDSPNEMTKLLKSSKEKFLRKKEMEKFHPGWGKSN